MEAKEIPNVSMKGSKRKLIISTSEQRRRLLEIIDNIPMVRLGFAPSIDNWVLIAEELNLLNGPKKSWENWRKTYYSLRRFKKILCTSVSPLSSHQDEKLISNNEIKVEYEEEEPLSAFEPANPNIKKYVSVPIQMKNCRLCLKPYANRSLNHKIRNVHPIWQKIRELVNIQVHPSDGLPDRICTICFTKLKASLDFVQKCKETDKKIRKIFKLDAESNNKVTIKSEIENVDNLIIKQEKDLNFPNTTENQDLKLTEENTSNVECTNDFTLSTENNFDNQYDSDTAKKKKHIKIFLPAKEQEPKTESINKEVRKPKEVTKGEQPNNKKKRKPYRQCNLCGKFLSGCLKTHMLIHTDDRPYFICELCDKKLYSKTALENHIKIHTGERPFACEICGYTFISKINLLRHVFSHTGIKPHVCHCGKKYTTVFMLKRHMKYHHNNYERTFKCTQCNYAGTKRVDLRKHVDFVHRKLGQTECNICGKVLSGPSTLKRHMMIHTGEKPFQCKHCPARFIQKSDMLKHEQSHGRAKKRKQTDSDEE